MPTLTAAEPSRVFKARSRAGGTLSIADDRGPDPLRFRAHPASNGRPPPWRLDHPQADGVRFERTHDLRRDLRLPTGHLASSVNHPRAESGLLESHALADTIRLATGPGAPVRFTLHVGPGLRPRLVRADQPRVIRTTWACWCSVFGKTRTPNTSCRTRVRREGVGPSRPARDTGS